MLKSYPAILKNGQLDWINEKPDSTKALHVVVLAEAPVAERDSQEINRLLAETRGVLPRRAAADLDETLDELRAEWRS
jgi:hypothetical protein